MNKKQMNETLKDMLGMKVAIHCETVEECREMLKSSRKIYKQGVDWRCVNFDYEDDWGLYKEETCYYIDEGELIYSSIDQARRDGCIVIDFEDVGKEKSMVEINKMIEKEKIRKEVRKYIGNIALECGVRTSGAAIMIVGFIGFLMTSELVNGGMKLTYVVCCLTTALVGMALMLCSKNFGGNEE